MKEGAAGQVMTGDEWRARGLDCAVSAEGSSAIFLLQSAVQCFKRAKDTKLLHRASAELEMKVLMQRFEGRNADKTLTSDWTRSRRRRRWRWWRSYS